MVRWGPRITKRDGMIVSGIGLLLACVMLLFFVYGFATMLPPDEPGCWALVLERMFKLSYGGGVAIPASVGLFLGIGLVALGIIRKD